MLNKTNFLHLNFCFFAFCILLFAFAFARAVFIINNQ